MQMVEHVLMKQVRLVKQEDGMDTLASEILDMEADGIEDGGRRRRGIQAERQTELAIEITPSKRGIVAVGQPEACLRQAMAHRAQHARLSDARLAVEEHLGALAHGLADRVDELLLRRRQPKILIGDLLRKCGFRQLKEAKVGFAHGSPRSEVDGSVSALRRSAFAGSKPVRRKGVASATRGGLLRRAFLTGSSARSTRRLPSCSTHGGSAGATKHCATTTFLPARKP